MLLAVISLYDAGVLQDNEVHFNADLCDAFKKLFPLFSGDGDRCQPSRPYFHLRSEPFWFHKVRPGKESYYASLDKTERGDKRIWETIEYAYLSDYAYSILSSSVHSSRTA